MKGRILDPQVYVYGSMEDNAISVAILKEGTDIEFGGTRRKAGKLWVPILLSTGQQAFIRGETRIELRREGTLMQGKADLHSEASVESPVRKQLGLNDRVSILQVIKGTRQSWVRVRDISGNEGFIPGDTRIRVIQQKSKALGRKNMMTGVMWLIIGLVLAFSDIFATSGGSFRVLGYAAILFGAVMLIYGVVQFITSPI